MDVEVGLGNRAAMSCEIRAVEGRFGINDISREQELELANNSELCRPAKKALASSGLNICNETAADAETWLSDSTFHFISRLQYKYNLPSEPSPIPDKQNILWTSQSILPSSLQIVRTQD